MTIASLGYVIIKTRDLDAWRVFATQVMGLMPAELENDSDRLFFRMDDRPFRFLIERSDEERFDCGGWELRSEAEFEALIETLGRAKVEVARGSPEAAALRRVDGLARFSDPDGNAVEIYHGRHLDYAPFTSPAGVKGFVTGEMGLGHIVLPAPGIEQSYAFYRDVLGFGLSDEMHFRFSGDPEDPGQHLYFMHADNPRHHSLALFEASMPSGLVHVMVEALDIDDVGMALDRAMAAEVPITASLGRHSNDGMISFYMGAPGGFMVEFGCDGLQLDWSRHTPTRSLRPDLWGHKYQYAGE